MRFFEIFAKDRFSCVRSHIGEGSPGTSSDRLLLGYGFGSCFGGVSFGVVQYSESMLFAHSTFF